MSKQENLTREKFNNLKKYYDETWDEREHTLHVGLFKKDRDSLFQAYRQATDYLIKNTESILPFTKESVVLDIGCGTGRTVIEICSKYNCKGVGIDVSDEQIKDAKLFLKELNTKRILKGEPKIRVKYIRASGSDLDKTFKKSNQFTHVISQDAILLVSNKESLFRNISRILTPGGVFAAADFLSETVVKERTESEESLVYRLVNWNESLSFAAYEEILKENNLNIIKSERRDKDMTLTYEKLAQKMEDYKSEKDQMYTELKERYQSIVSSVRSKKMGWGLFFTQKPLRKTAVIAGTKEKSIGRFIATELHTLGWNVWLYSRDTKRVENEFWHERKCDISSELSIQKFLSEINNVDLVMMLADTTGGHSGLLELTEENITGKLNAKLAGSLLLCKALANKYPSHHKPIKIVWCAGNPANQTKGLSFYRMINSSLVSIVDTLNSHYNNIFKAYYILTGVISPSTLGDDYIQKFGPEIKRVAKSPLSVMENVKRVIADEVAPGIVGQ